MRLDRFIIYTDLDGTAVHSNHNVNAPMPQNNIDALKHFVSEGGLLSAASGRSHNSVKKLFGDIKINAPIVEANGAYVYDVDTESYLSKTYIKTEVKKELYEYVKKDKSLYLTTMKEDGTKRVEYGDDREETILDFYRPLITKEDLFENNNSKCGIVGDPKRIDEVLVELNSLKTRKDMTIARSAPIYAEVFDSTANKGAGIKKALELKNIKDRILVCVGDYYNDIDMLKIADIAICPENAVPEVKELCQYITCDDASGCLAEVIDYLERL